MDLAELVRRSWAQGPASGLLDRGRGPVLGSTQVEQPALLADDAQVDVYAFGIATDFRGRLFPGSARLFVLADEVIDTAIGTGRVRRPTVRYQVLCRARHRSGQLGPDGNR